MSEARNSGQSASSSLPCMSDKKDKAKKLKEPLNPATPPPSSSHGGAAVPAVGAVPMSALQRTVQDEMIRAWTTRPFSRFPCHKDIPRFVRSLMVISSAGEEIYKPDPAETQAAAIQRLLTQLATTFEPTNVKRLTAPLAALPDKVDTDSMSAAFQAMDDIDNVTSPTMNLLKAINQGILAPALVNLQLSFMGTKFMFADITWNILVQIFEDHVRVEHRRFEGFANGSGHFGWSAMLLIRRRDMHLLSVKTKVFEYRIPDAVIEAEWAALIKPIFELETKAMCSQILAKTWDRLPIAKDLARFATNTTFILGHDNTAISTLGSDPVQHVKHLLLKISEIAKDEASKQLIESTFEEQVAKAKNGDLNAIFKSYFMDTLKWTDDSIIARFCKFFTQSILAPLATNLQIGLSHLNAVKDGSSWTVHISLVPDAFVIRHTKTQMTLNRTDPQNCFDFTWQAEFEVDLEVKEIRSLRARIVSITFPLADQMTEALLVGRTKELTSLLNVTLI